MRRIIIYQCKTNCFIPLLFIAILCCDNNLQAQNNGLINLSPESNSLLNKLRKFRRSSNDSAFSFANYVIETAKSNGDKQLENEANFELGRIYFAKDDQIKALEIVKNAESNSLPQTYCYYNAPQFIGFILNRQGKADEALVYMFKALERIERDGMKMFEASANFTIADAYRENKNSGKAIKYVLKGMQIAEAGKDTSQLINAYSNLGLVLSNREYVNDERLDSAIFYQQKIMTPEIMKKWINPYDSAKHFSNMGRLYRMKKQFDLAKSTLNIALDVAERRQFKSLQQSILNEIATLELNIGNTQNAVAIQTEAKNIIPANQTSLNRVKELVERTQEANSDIGNYKEAYQGILNANTIKDSLYSLKNQAAITEIEKKYQRDKKVLEANIALQKKENERNIIIGLSGFIILISTGIFIWKGYKRRKQSEFLKTLIHEVNHRTKNNLQMLNSLIAGIYQNVKDDAIKLEIKKLSSYIKSFGLVYDSLNKSASFDDVDIAVYTQHISKAVIGNISDEELELIYTSDSNIIVETDKAILIGIIMNELITNSLKHAFESTSKNKIAIQLLKQEDKKLSIIYEDNGVGEININPEKKSFGTNMIGQLVKQLQGTMLVEPSHPKKITINIPLN